MHYIISPLFQYPRINELSSTLIQAANGQFRCPVRTVCDCCVSGEKDNFLGMTYLPLDICSASSQNVFIRNKS